MAGKHTDYIYDDMEVIVTGDYKYPFKGVRRIIYLPQFAQQNMSNSNAFAIFCTVNPQETSGGDLNRIHLWADGTVPAGTDIEINLLDGINGSPVAVYPIPLSETNTLYVCEWCDGREFINTIPYLMGLDQPDNLPSMITVTGSQNIYPLTTRWKNGTAVFTPKAINKYIASSINETITITSDYRDSNNVSHTCYGSLTKLIYYNDEIKEIIIPKPVLIYDEPLTYRIYLEAYNGVFIRDGIQSPNVIVESYWKGQPIKPQVIINEGTSNEKTIYYPLPQVIYNVNNSSAVLTSYVAKSEYVRTSIYPTDYPSDSESNFHEHPCTVDDNGNGITDVPFVLKGNVASHIHNIDNFVALENLGHTHDVECVSITQINPTTKNDTNMTIDAYIPYDPTNSQPIVQPPNYPSIPGTNRIAKASLGFDTSSHIDPTLPTKPILTVDVFTSNSVASIEHFGGFGSPLPLPIYSTSVIIRSMIG